MRKRLVLFLMLLISVNILINAEPYKPKPILFVHGLNGNSKCWGVSPDTITINGKKIKSDSINKDSMINGKILPVCLEKLKPMVWAWYNWENEREMAKSVNIFHSGVKILHTFGKVEIISNEIVRLVILA